MPITTALLPTLLQAIADVIEANAEEITALDQAIGDGDHVYNLQRGLNALLLESHTLTQLDWVAAWQKIGMTLMTTVGGASGSLYGTLFVKMSKAAAGQPITLETFADIFTQGVEAMKQRGKADIGEKTMLDVLIPVAISLQQATAQSLSVSAALQAVTHVSLISVEATRELLATKGRASFLGERSRGHIDAGAKTAQLMINAIATVITEQLASPA
ncbi:MAG: dihydroxyacetone kinase subunit DhaL [Methylococcales bacterium]|nr:dihydroxyacetone kinase subunit DhaL [Methylococcales bacterium]